MSDISSIRDKIRKSSRNGRESHTKNSQFHANPLNLLSYHLNTFISHYQKISTLSTHSLVIQNPKNKSLSFPMSYNEQHQVLSYFNWWFFDANFFSLCHRKREKTTKVKWRSHSVEIQNFIPPHKPTHLIIKKFFHLVYSFCFLV